MKDYIFTVSDLTFLTKNAFKLTLNSKEKLEPIKAGQFVNLKINDGSMLLRRPFCLYDYDDFNITLIIAVVGKGTKKLSTLKNGDIVLGVLPLGNGFSLSENHKKVALIGGGIGCAPLLKVGKSHKNKEFVSYLGFSTRDNVILTEDFKTIGRVVVSTDDGSLGQKGYVSESFSNDLKNFRPDVILTCGAENMIKAVKSVARENNIEAYMSGETRMACGVGACLVCACALKKENDEVSYVRACCEGPVFNLEDIEL